MNIKDHIIAGHYPTDDKGRALVPMRRGDGRTATIYATDCPIPGQPIAGWDGTSVEWWTAEGHFHSGGGGYSPLDLLPPPPRKVKATCWASFMPKHAGTGGALGAIVCWNREPTEDERLTWARDGVRVVELTGEYDEPWS